MDCATIECYGEKKKKWCVCECCVSDLFLFDVIKIASCQRDVSDNLILLMHTQPPVVQVR